MGSIKIWDGTAWQTASGSAGSNETWVGPNAPPGTPTLGDLWYDTDDTSTTLALPLAVTSGGTGGTTPAAARTSLAMPGEELAYDQITTNQTITSTSLTAQQTVIAGTARTYDGSPVIIEFYSARVDNPSGGQTLIHLADGAADLGYFVLALATAGVGFAASGRRRITPTVGTHTYRVTAWLSGGTGSGLVGAGPGNANNVFSPAFLRVTRA